MVARVQTHQGDRGSRKFGSAGFDPAFAFEKIRVAGCPEVERKDSEISCEGLCIPQERGADSGTAEILRHIKRGDPGAKVVVVREVAGVDGHAAGGLAVYNCDKGDRNRFAVQVVRESGGDFFDGEAFNGVPL